MNRIQEKLNEAERSQSWLSRKIGISNNAVSRWCRNVKQPRLNDLNAIANALNIDVKELIV